MVRGPAVAMTYTTNSGFEVLAQTGTGAPDK
jgi:hypothetical protein